MSKRLEGIGWYNFELLKAMAKAHPETEFICFFDRKVDPVFIVEPNIIPVVLHPMARHPFLFYVWFQWSVRRALAKYRVDVFFSPDGFLCLNTSVPTLLTMHDLAYIAYPEALVKMDLWHYRRFVPKFIRRADHILTVSDFVKKEIETYFPEAKGKITSIHNGLRDGFRALSVEEQDSVREKLTDGKEYFFYLGAIHPRKNIHRLIEAFDLFCAQNPQNDHQLVIGGRLAWQSGPVEKALRNSRFRSRIHLIGSVEEAQLPLIVASANAIVYMSLYEGFGLPIIEAMQSGVPVITSKDTAMDEIAGDAALLADPQSAQSIADALVLVTSDSVLRKNLIDAGKERVMSFSWDHAADEVYLILMQLASSKRL
ncbi:MAG: glycosyltransferase family 1 protein [Saprospiraceae bacterium]